MKNPDIVFFGGEPLGVPVLEELKTFGIIPKLIVCNPDRPSGRKMQLKAPPVKVWAKENSIEVFQPDSLKDAASGEKLSGFGCNLFVVVAYGSIIPKNILDIPDLGTINLHPSLLPKYRGPNPIREAILNDDRDGIGVSIMLLDEEMDHGPLLAHKKMIISEENWPIRGQKLDEALAHLGGALLADVIPKWAAGAIESTEQNHNEATYTHKLTKEMGELHLNDDAHKNLLKIRALDGWPGTYFFTEKNGKQIRVKVTDAEIAPDDSLNILKVIPEGKKETMYVDFQKS